MKRMIKCSSEWANDWSKRADSDGLDMYVLSIPTGTARVFNNGNGTYHAEIKWRNGDNRSSTAKNTADEAMSWAEKLLFSLYTSTQTRKSSVEASADPHEPSTEYDWMEGLYWDWEGHTIEIVQVDSSLGKCKVTESWITEDLGKNASSTSIYDIREDDDGNLYIASKFQPGFRLYVSNALNYMEPLDDESEDWDYDEDEFYTPSATRGDYSPSNPWDAPGMSVKDFI